MDMRQFGFRSSLLTLALPVFIWILPEAGYAQAAKAIGIPQFNPSLSEGGRALLAPASSFSGPQTFNPSISPESRVLLAPIPKPKAVKKKSDVKKPEGSEAQTKAGQNPGSVSSRSQDSAQEPGLKDGPAQGASTAGSRASAKNGAGPNAQAATLDAIRAKLVESAQKAGVRVRSLAWLDEKGQLYESNRFDSLAKVRGIRVNEYLGVTSVDVNDVTAEALPQDCGPEATKFLRHAYFKAHAGKGGEYFSGHQLQVIAQTLSPDFEKLLSSQTGWRFSAAPAGTSGFESRSLYEQRLLGRSSESAGYRLEVEVSDMGSFSTEQQRPPPSAGRGPAPQWLVGWAQQVGLEPAPVQAGVLGISVSLVDLSSGRVEFQTTAELPMRLIRRGYLEPFEPVVQDMQQAQTILTGLRLELQKAMRCMSPEYPVIERRSGDRFVIQAGRSLGLETGTQVLLSPSTQFVKKVLQPGVVESLALGVVESAGEHQAVVRFLEGPKPSASATLVAMPF
jgi:hypothetical protein